MPTIRQFFYITTAATLAVLSTSAKGQDPVSSPDAPPAPVAEIAPVTVPVQEAPPAKIVDNGPLPLIIPAAKVPVGGMPADKMMIVEGQPSATTLIDPSEYRRIYNSIPFNRAEYNANPSYRHDTTMEILTGTARHQTIVQHNHEHKQPVKRIPNPEIPSRVIQPHFGFGFPRAYPFWFRGHVW